MSEPQDAVTALADSLRVVLVGIAWEGEEDRLEAPRGLLESLRAEGYVVQAAGELDGDASYPDYGPEDDAAAGMGLPARTTGTLDVSGHRCDWCPVEVRSLYAYAHNAMTAMETAWGAGDWARARRKVDELAEFLRHTQPALDAHFAAQR